jgi:uncharacterized protein (DUF1501 family)
MPTRRDFLRTASLLALTPAVPAFLARSLAAAPPERDGCILVVVQLDGGNDGINTVVPFADEGYAKHRKQLRLSKDQVVKLTDSVGLHPALRELGKRFESKQFAIVQGVGYPNPSRSHFESMAVWQTARRDPEEHKGLGWLGRGFDESKQKPGATPVAAFVGPGFPLALRSRRSLASALTRPEDLLLAADARMRLEGPDDSDELLAYAQRMAVQGQVTAERMQAIVKPQGSSASYPSNELAEHLKLIARLIKADLGTRVFYTNQSGYDTHAGQYGTHFRLLSDLGGAIQAFLNELDKALLAERVVIFCFSEFGRTVVENGSGGTDHGTAAPVLLLGPAVQGGLVGATPSLTDLDPKHGDLKVSHDFRQIYRTLLEDWLGLPSEAALGAKFEKLPLLRG